MSVILQIANFTIAQGTSNFNEPLGLTNSGTENATSLKLKVTDSVIFDVLKVYSSMYGTCLNAFSTGSLRNWTNTNSLFPAGTTKTIRFEGTVKAAAPIQIHNLSCDFQYTVY